MVELYAGMLLVVAVIYDNYASQNSKMGWMDMVQDEQGTLSVTKQKGAVYLKNHFICHKRLVYFKYHLFYHSDKKVYLANYQKEYNHFLVVVGNIYFSTDYLVCRKRTVQKFIPLLGILESTAYPVFALVKEP